MRVFLHSCGSFKPPPHHFAFPVSFYVVEEVTGPLHPPTIHLGVKLKDITARKVFQRFPEIKKELWGGAFWSRSYYVGSVGDMSVDAVLKYIELGQQ